MSNRSVAIISVGVVGLLAVLVVVQFLATHERKEVEVDLGAELEVLTRPFLALETFLNKLEIEVDASPDPHDPQDVDEVDIIFMDPGLALYEGWSREVDREWIKDGGHLVLVEPDEAVGRGEEFVTALGLTEYDVQFDPDEIYEDWDVSFAELPSQVTRDYPLDSRVNDTLRWRDTIMAPESVDFVVVTEDEELPVAASTADGEGRLTVITERDFLTNEGMEWDGMGEVTADLLTLQGEWPQEAVIFLRHQRRGWFSEALQRGWPFFVGLLILLLFGFSRARRFGPAIPQPDRRRQRRREHIRATGHFLWKHHGQAAMIDASRRALIEAVARRRPSIRKLKSSRRFEIMSEELQISAERLRALLDGPIPRRANDFQSMIARLEELRRKM